MAAKIKISIRKTGTFERVFVFKDASLAAIDMTGSTFKMTIGDIGGAPDDTFTTATGEIVSTDLSAGTITIKFDPGTFSAAFEKTFELFRVTGADESLLAYGPFNHTLGIGT